MTTKTLSIFTLILFYLPILSANIHLLENIEMRADRLFDTIDTREFNITSQTDPQSLIGAITTLEYHLSENKTLYSEQRSALKNFYLGIIQEMKMLLLDSITPKDDTEESLARTHEQHATIRRIFSAAKTTPLLQYPLAKASLNIIDALCHAPITRPAQQRILSVFRNDLHTTLRENQLPSYEQFSVDDLTCLETIFISFLAFHGESWMPDSETLYTWTCRSLKVVGGIVAIGGAIYLGKQVYNTIGSANTTLADISTKAGESITIVNKKFEALCTEVQQTILEVNELIGPSKKVSEDSDSQGEQEKKPHANIPELLGELAQTLQVAQQTGKDVEEYLKPGGKLDGILHNIREMIAHPICGGNFMTHSIAPLSASQFLNLSCSSAGDLGTSSLLQSQDWSKSWILLGQQQ